jgi:CRISPR-associated protein Cmr1
MRQVTFTLRVLTPLFLAGAEQTSAELRAPTFRGLMRYWYRALIGGMVGTEQSGLKQVAQAESALFGITE